MRLTFVDVGTDLVLGHRPSEFLHQLNGVRDDEFVECLGAGAVLSEQSVEFG